MSFHEILQRTRRTAAVNGGSVAAVAGLSALVSLFLLCGFGCAVGLAFAATGVMELRGRSLLARDVHRAGRWLVGAPAAVFALIAAYGGYHLATLTGAAILQAMSPDMLALIKQRLELQTGLQLPDEVIGDVLLRAMRLVYWVLIVVSFFYQGGMAWYYQRRIRTLQRSDTDD